MGYYIDVFSVKSLDLVSDNFGFVKTAEGFSNDAVAPFLEVQVGEVYEVKVKDGEEVYPRGLGEVVYALFESQNCVVFV